MSRESRSVYVKQRVLVKDETRKCDKCGAILTNEDEWDQNELLIFLNPDECVNSRVRLDLCNDCVGPIWNMICKAIDADPNVELRIGQDD